jgi:hypothetical protein
VLWLSAVLRSGAAHSIRRSWCRWQGMSSRSPLSPPRQCRPGTMSRRRPVGHRRHLQPWPACHLRMRTGRRHRRGARARGRGSRLRRWRRPQGQCRRRRRAPASGLAMCSASCSCHGCYAAGLPASNSSNDGNRSAIVSVEMVEEAKEREEVAWLGIRRKCSCGEVAAVQCYRHGGLNGRREQPR